MTGRFTPQNLLIYVAMAEFGFAFICLASGRRRLGWAQYIAAFTMALAAVVYRRLHTGHVPLQNLYEVFLVLAALMLPLSLFGRFVLRVGGEAFDALLAAALLVPPGFIFSAEPKLLPPALQSPLFVPHVLAYMLAYVILAKAAVVGAVGMIRKTNTNPAAWRESSPARSKLIPYDRAVYRLVCLGFPFLSAGLLLGAMWGKRAWGDWWNWDPKELWSLATWLVYALYFHARAMLPGRRPRLEAALAITGLAFIVITLLWANLSRLFPGLHTYAM